MFMDKLIKHKTYIILTVLYMLLTTVVGAILQNGLILFLTINMFLAALSWGISLVVEYLDEKKIYRWIIIVMSLVWVLFFPNAIYMTTDFIHLQNYSFFEIYSISYTYLSMDWLVLLIIFTGATYSAYLGIMSIKKMIKIHQINNQYKYIWLTGLFALSSIGIYIGRFIRLNSWDFYRLDIIFSGIFNEFVFFLSFVGIFIVIHYIYYFLFKDKV
ncbi:MAG: DUF1361 domain-containing protein [Acholeplasmataceae bacterium]